MITAINPIYVATKYGLIFYFHLDGLPEGWKYYWVRFHFPPGINSSVDRKELVPRMPMVVGRERLDLEGIHFAPYLLSAMDAWEIEVLGDEMEPMGKYFLSKHWPIKFIPMDKLPRVQTRDDRRIWVHQ